MGQNLTRNVGREIREWDREAEMFCYLKIIVILSIKTDRTVSTEEKNKGLLAFIS